MPTLACTFMRFNEWAEIDSVYEGHFLERVSPGAAKKTIREAGDSLRVLFNHGKDPSVGNKPLGAIERFEETGDDLTAIVPLLDTQYVRELLPGLERGLYGASFRMHVLRERVEKFPERSEQNPDGLPEHTITEMRLFELGPVTFPAYKGAVSTVRSLTDEFVFEWLVRNPSRGRDLLVPDLSLRAVDLDEAGAGRAVPNVSDVANDVEPEAPQDEAPSEDDDAVPAKSGGTSREERRDASERRARTTYGLDPSGDRPMWSLE